MLSGRRCLEGRRCFSCRFVAGALTPFPFVSWLPLPWLPLVGPVAQNVWAFTGLGAKGLLMAPLLAQHLPEWLTEPDAIWPEVSTLA